MPAFAKPGRMQKSVAAGTLALATALTLASPGCAAQTDAPATVPACANPQVPASILDGPAAERSPLPMTTASGAKFELQLAVASDENSRELGLMCVLRLRPQHGMIFVFDGGDRSQEFWMKNTLVPLDMVWVRADGTIDTVAANVPASTRTTPDDKIARRFGRGKYVIELAAGEAAADGLQGGGHLKIAALP